MISPKELVRCVKFAHFRYSYLYFILISLQFNLSYGLYEDQIGKFDWRQMYVGHVKYAEFDTVSTVKKVFVATDENVVAALNLKSGNIIWRQVLEKREQGTIHFMNVSSDAVVTVSGNNPVNVRGWDLNGGFLLWDWSFPLHVSLRSTDNNQWFFLVSESTIYHVSLITNSEISITPYDVISGSPLVGAKVSLPVNPQHSRCVVVAPYLTCLEVVNNSPVLYTTSLIVGKSKTESKALKPLIEDPEPSFEVVHGSQPLIAISSSASDVKYLFLIEDSGAKVLPYQVDKNAKLVQDSLRESNILLQMLFTEEGTPMTLLYEETVLISDANAVSFGQFTIGILQMSDNFSVLLLQFE